MTNTFGKGGQVNTKWKDIGYCNICDSHGPLTEDHVPPKGTLGIGQVDMLHITTLLSIERLTKGVKRRHMQGGVKFKTLCSRCNNSLLGAKYDPVLIAFSNSVSDFLKSSLQLPNVASVRTTPGLLARAVLGHLAAIGFERRQRTALLSEALEFFLDESRALPDGLNVYYWLYPYKAQVQIRDAVLARPVKGGADMIHFWCLKYFPMAFMVTWGIDSPRLPLMNLRDSIIHAGTHEAEVPLPLAGIIHRHWPEAPTDNSVVLYGDGAVGAVPHAPR